MNKPKKDSNLETTIRNKYGELLTTKDIVEILKYPTTNALLKAISRKSIDLKVFKIPGKRGWHCTAEELANYIERYERIHPSK